MKHTPTLCYRYSNSRTRHPRSTLCYSERDWFTTFNSIGLDWEFISSTECLCNVILDNNYNDVKVSYNLNWTHRRVVITFILYIVYFWTSHLMILTLIKSDIISRQDTRKETVCLFQFWSKYSMSSQSA